MLALTRKLFPVRFALPCLDLKYKQRQGALSRSSSRFAELNLLECSDGKWGRFKDTVAPLLFLTQVALSNFKQASQDPL